MTERKNDKGGIPTRIPIPRFEGIPDFIQPYVDLGAKFQSEFATLCSHRSEAWLNWPASLATCKMPTDVAMAQIDFASKMQRDYAQFIDGLLRDALIEQDELDEGVEQSRQAASASGQDLAA